MRKRVFFDKVEEDRLHYKNLKYKVNERLKEIPKSRKFWVQFKAVLLPILYVLFYVIRFVFFVVFAHQSDSLER